MCGSDRPEDSEINRLLPQEPFKVERTTIVPSSDDPEGLVFYAWSSSPGLPEGEYQISPKIQIFNVSDFFNDCLRSKPSTTSSSADEPVVKKQKRIECVDITTSNS